MEGSRQCPACQRSYALTPDTVSDITQVEHFICLKEGLNAWQAKKVTCPHCGTASLAHLGDIGLTVPASERVSAPSRADAPEGAVSAFSFGTRFDAFIPLWPYVWPSLCACCYGTASGTFGVTTNLKMDPLEKALGKEGARLLVHQLAGRVPNLKVTDTPGSALVVEFRVPYCGHCRLHDGLGFAGLLGYVAAASIVSLFLAALALALVLAIFSENTRAGLASLMAPEWLGRGAIGVGIVAMLVLLGFVARTIGNATRQEKCAPLQKAVELEEGGGLIGWIQFGNAEYARAFARANQLTPVGGDPEVRRAPDSSRYLQ